MFGIESSGADKEEDDDDDWVKCKNDTRENRDGEDDCLGAHCPISEVGNCPQLHLIEPDWSHDGTILVIMWQEISQRSPPARHRETVSWSTDNSVPWFLMTSETELTQPRSLRSHRRLEPSMRVLRVAEARCPPPVRSPSSLSSSWDGEGTLLRWDRRWTPSRIYLYYFVQRLLEGDHLWQVRPVV